MTEVIIICNGCGSRSRPYKNAGNHGLMTIRGELRQAGWQTGERNQKDFCPDCRKKRDTKGKS